ncbi:hypothetical protein ACH4OY_30365 [Micromonospora rubida]|uniref:HD domain-containing protein n=1 Tax=Micromonospora rubida TaxID=2697657 RepID=A0ABW7STA8_9ACTN
MTTVGRALALWDVSRHVPHPDPTHPDPTHPDPTHPDPTHAALHAIAARTPDPADPRQARDLHHALDHLDTTQHTLGSGHCHTIAATLTAAAHLHQHPPGVWLAGVYYRAAARHTIQQPGDQHLWDSLDLITAYDTLTAHHRAHHTAAGLVRDLVTRRGYLDPLTIASSLTWAHIHPSPEPAPTPDGLEAVAASAVSRIPQPMLRAALTGLARLTTSTTPCRNRSKPITRLANPRPPNTTAATS